MTPHKHAALIKAWAENTDLKFQFRGAGCQSNCWYDMSPSNPDWSVNEIRIKPTTIKYRIALFKSWEGPNPIALTHPYNNQHKDNPNFIRYLTDWIEVEV